MVQTRCSQHQIFPHQKSESAHNNNQYRYHVYIWICDILLQARLAENVDSSIAECGDGMKYRIPETAQQTILRDKSHRIKHRPAALYEKRAADHIAQQYDNSGHRMQIIAVLNHHAAADRDLFS